MTEKWREFKFYYRVPEGVDFQEVEDAMADSCATFIGCDCDENSEYCKAAWTASSAPFDLDDDDGV